MSSIRRYLVRTLALLLMLATCLAVLAAYLITDHELEELLDAQLSYQGRLLAALVTPQTSEEDYIRLARQMTQPSHPVRLYRDGRPMAFEQEGVAPRLFHEEERKQSIGLWDEDGAPRLIGARWSEGAAFPAPDEPGHRWIEHGGHCWRVFSLFDADSAQWISVGMRASFMREIVERVALNNLLPMVFLLPLLLWLMGRIIRRGLAPIDALSRQVQDRDVRDLTCLEGEVPRELGGLREALDAFIARLREAFERERRFTADAAHELRTPLAALKIHLDNARAGEQGALTKAQLGIERLQRVVEQLLVLARLDRQEVSARETIDLYALTTDLAAELWPLAHARRQHLALSGLSHLQVHGDVVEMGILLRNLLDNALRYTPEGGEIEVELTRARQAPCVIVRDSGPGIPEGLLDKVTERFRRASNQRITGSGLGLSIVLELARRQRARLVLANRRPHGLEARIIWAGEVHGAQDIA